MAAFQPPGGGGVPPQPIAPHRAASSTLQPPRPPPLAGARSAESVAGVAQKWLAACRQGNYAIVQRGIREGWAPVNAIDPTGGYTALMRCCVSGQMLDLLLGCRGIDVNLTGASDGTTPLLLAARYRSPRSVDALLRAGAAGLGAGGEVGPVADDAVDRARIGLARLRFLEVGARVAIEGGVRDNRTVALGNAAARGRVAGDYRFKRNA